MRRLVFFTLFVPYEGLGGVCPGPRSEVISSPSGAGLSGFGLLELYNLKHKVYKI